MTIRAIGLALAACALLAGCDESENGRMVTSLCGPGWRFRRDTTAKAQLNASAIAHDDSTWARVEVPHDWAIGGPFDPEAKGGTGKLPWQGVGWYRRTFRVSDATLANVRAGGALWLEFDGVMARPKVYVNGVLAGGWNYGYMGFRVDAAPFVRAGVNTLAVRADTRDHHSRWYPGAGVYRAVRLVEAPAAHVLPGSEFVCTPGVSRDSATVRVAFAVTNRVDGSAGADVGVRVCDPIGVVVAETGTSRRLPASGAETFSFDIEVHEPQLWDVETPRLYEAVLAVRARGRLDVQRVRFGIRTAEFTVDDGFHLNGRRVQLQGVDLHSDLGPLGMAFNRSAMRRQLEIMKEMGANALRTSHNACDPQVLELCDELGIVVWNECFDKWDGTSGRRPDENLEDYVCENLRAFARRDRNHPCVVVWSIGNEIPPYGWDWKGKNPKAVDGMSAERFRLFRAAIRAFDETRPVAIGCCHSQAIETGMFEELDMTGWNYREQYLPFRKRHPDKPVVYSESASALSSYGAFEQPPANGRTAYDVAHREVGAYEHNAAPWSDIPDVEFARMERDRFCGGEFVWTGIDYLGEPTPYVGGGGYFPMMKGLKPEELARSSYFGIVDLMGVPKDRYWLYRAHWNRSATTLHISPHWNWKGREGQPTPVYVYTDGDEAELFLNGRSLGRRRKGEVTHPKSFALDSYYDVCARYRLRWFDVPYEPGELRVVAFRQGKKIGETTMRTAGKPVAVQLTPEKSVLADDGDSCVFVQVDVVDGKGVRDPLATDRVAFKLTGPGRILAVGNGNARAHESFQDVGSHPLYFGKAVAVLRRDKGSSGPITLTASVEGLKPATYTFR